MPIINLQDLASAGFLRSNNKILHSPVQLGPSRLLTMRNLGGLFSISAHDEATCPSMIHLADCIQFMKEMQPESVDLLLTDPPYGMSFQSNYRTVKYSAIKNDNTLCWLDDFVDGAYRAMRNNTAGYVFCSFHHIDKFKQAIERKFKIKNVLVWEKNNTSMGDLKGDFAPKVEFIILFHKGRSLIRGKREPNIFRFARTKNALHPTEKPIDLCAYLISKFSDEGGVVFDPFAGSGTTGAAALSIGRKFLGCELDPAHFKTASERLRAA